MDELKHLRDITFFYNRLHQELQVINKKPAMDAGDRMTTTSSESAMADKTNRDDKKNI